MRAPGATRLLAGLAAIVLAACLGCSGEAVPVMAAPTARTSAVPTAAVPTAAGPSVGRVDSPKAGSVPSTGAAGPAPKATGPLTGRVIVVDPGHNGVYRRSVNTRLVPAGNGKKKACNSSGTATNAGYAEHTFTWKAASNLVRELRSRGATVVLTRPNDAGTGPCVNERAAIGNRAHADLVVSIHADGSYAAGARGFHLILSPTMIGGWAVEARSRALALRLRSQIRSVTGMPRSTYIGKGTALSVRKDIAGLNLSKVPAVMLETGNMRNPHDVALLTSAEFRQLLATALANGVEAWLKG